MTRFVYLHGNGALHWSAAFAPWLKNSLEENGHETFFETMPDSVRAKSKYWLKFLYEIVKVQPADVLVGWSSGAVAAMRYAQTHQLAGMVLIGPHYTDLGSDFEKASGYFDEEWDWQSIRHNVGFSLIFHGDHDPYISRNDFLHIAESLQGERHEINGGEHFEAAQEIPGLINAIKKALEQSR